MRRLVAAELRRLVFRPATVLALVLCALGTVVLAWVAQDFAVLQHEAAERAVAWGDERCAPVSAAERDRCLRDTPHDRAAAAALLAESVRISTVAASGQPVPGAFTWACRVIGTFPGLVLAFFLAAVGTAEEWTRGTISRLLLAEPRVGRLVLAKSLAVWCVGLLAVVGAGAAVALFSAVYGAERFPLQGFHPSLGDQLVTLVTSGTAALLLLALYAVAGVLTAALLRAPVPTLLAGLVVTAILSTTAGLPWIGPWTPGGVVADLMGYQDVHGVWDHFWPAATGSGVSVWLRSLPLALLGVLVGRRASRWLTRRDPLD